LARWLCAGAYLVWFGDSHAECWGLDAEYGMRDAGRYLVSTSASASAPVSLSSSRRAESSGRVGTIIRQPGRASLTIWTSLDKSGQHFTAGQCCLTDYPRSPCHALSSSCLPSSSSAPVLIDLVSAYPSQHQSRTRSMEVMGSFNGVGHFDVVDSLLMSTCSLAP
jgi:hypothetical protein